jgi:ABC-2 type transport system permease protein
MRSLLVLTVANLRSFVRDRAATFWTIAFPLMFVALFGSIFSGTGDIKYNIGWVDQDSTQASAALMQAFGSIPLLTLKPADEQASVDAMKQGNVSAVIVVPKGYQATLGPILAGGKAPTSSGSSLVQLTLYTDPSRQQGSQTLQQIVEQVVGSLNQRMSGTPDLLGVTPKPVQTQVISTVAYLVPSILAMALMQLGLFGAVPLVEQREKRILKRLSATPLKRWTLVGSNVLMRLLVAIFQAIVVLGAGAILFNVTILGSIAMVAFLVLLGAAVFIAIGYVVASFAPTEESANTMTSLLQFPLMFLSGIFFPFEILPGFLKTIGMAMPLTYLGDAMRQVMVNGTAIAPLGVDLAILGGWLVVCLGISARFFRWQ